MKKIFKAFCFAAALSAAFSCSNLNVTPAFEDSKSFVAFDVTSVSVDENAGTLSIPVTIGSIDPKTVAVAYTSEDGTAKAGVNYNFKDPSAVLAFDGQTRTMNLEIDIVNLAGEYTGDLSFSVSLVQPGNLDLGANSSCSVKITDLDHPLASILGAYDVTAGYYTGTPCSWPLTLEKDPEDPTVVWIDYPVYFCYQYATWGDYSVYGTVSEDLKTITIPCGQVPGEKSGNPAWYEDETDLFVFGTWQDLGGGSVNLNSSGIVTMTMTSDGVWKTEDAPAAWLPSGSALTTGMLMTPGTLTWTKK